MFRRSCDASATPLLGSDDCRQGGAAFAVSIAIPDCATTGQLASVVAPCKVFSSVLWRSLSSCVVPTVSVAAFGLAGMVLTSRCDARRQIGGHKRAAMEVMSADRDNVPQRGY